MRWQKSWSARTIKQCVGPAANAGKLQNFWRAPGPCIISGVRCFDKLPDNLLNPLPRAPVRL